MFPSKLWSSDKYILFKVMWIFIMRKQTQQFSAGPWTSPRISARFSTSSLIRPEPSRRTRWFLGDVVWPDMIIAMKKMVSVGFLHKPALILKFCCYVFLWQSVIQVPDNCDMKVLDFNIFNTNWEQKSNYLLGWLRHQALNSFKSIWIVVPSKVVASKWHFVLDIYEG